ncbi:MAG TPA: hypothetical protein DCL38_01485, partial [Lachnospiraceae bacterium]|nr:hypothetical protein [Lachnospiraceae bacterium]
MAGIGRSVEGYLFLTEEDADIAKEEVSRINYVSSKMKDDNPQAVLAVYNRMIQNNTFITPVGQEYLRTLRDYLYRSSQIPDELVSDIPLIVSYSDALKKDKEPEKKPQEKKVRKTYKKEYQGALVMIAVLIVMIGAMFIIALKSDVPNIINYKTAITNEYAAWEQELSEREAAVRERE